MEKSTFTVADGYDVLIIGGDVIDTEGEVSVVGGTPFHISSGPSKSQIFDIRNFGRADRSYPAFKVVDESGHESTIEVTREFFRSATYTGEKVVFDLEGRGCINGSSVPESFYVLRYAPAF